MTQMELCLVLAMGSICVATLIVSFRAIKLDRELHAVKHVLQAFIQATVNEVSELNDKVDSATKVKKGKANG